MNMYTELQKFFGGMLVDFFSAIDDSYEYTQFIEGNHHGIRDIIKNMNISHEVAQHEYLFTIMKFERENQVVFLKFTKYENSCEGLSYGNDIQLVEQKEKVVYFFE